MNITENLVRFLRVISTLWAIFLLIFLLLSMKIYFYKWPCVKNIIFAELYLQNMSKVLLLIIDSNQNMMRSINQAKLSNHSSTVK